MESIITITFHGSQVVTKSINTRLNWTGIKCIANKLMNTSEWYFQYNDEEGDSILGSSEVEWHALIGVSKNHQQLPVHIYTIDHMVSGLALQENRPTSDSNSFVFVPESCCTTGSKNEVNEEKKTSPCCPPRVDSTKGCCSKVDSTEQETKSCCPKIEPTEDEVSSCCPSVETSVATTVLPACRLKPVGPIDEQTDVEAPCDVANGCCDYQRPLPPDPEYDENEILTKVVNPTLPQQKYTNEALRAVALPLGPVGGGCIAIAGDGGLRQWQISNKVNHNAQVPDSFFAIKVGTSAVVLQSSTWYDQKGFRPSAYISDHVVPVESKVLLSQIPGVKTVEVTAKFPVVEVDYTDDALKDIAVHLEAWSPKIPLNSQDSAIPVICFDFHVTNNRKDAVEVSLLGSLQNIIGWDGMTAIKNEVQFPGYGGNANSLYETSTLYGINMSNPSIPKDHERHGNVFLATKVQSGDAPSSLLQYTSVKDLWKALTSGSPLPGQGTAGVSPVGSTFNGATSNSRKVAAGQTSVFNYMIFWHIPNRFKDWYVDMGLPNTPVWVGTHYAKIWKTIELLVSTTFPNVDKLRRNTYKFRDGMFKSTLPWQMVDSAAGRVSVLNSMTCMWNGDGYFYAFEGCSNRSGCCALNCTHVWNYEMTLAYLYPDLERTMREIDLLHQITPHGVIPSRTEAPLQFARKWEFLKDYSWNPASCWICVDGEVATIMKTYREIKNGASKKWYSTMWNPVKLVMKHWLDVLDTEKNGLVYGPTPNTFDVCTYGYMVIWGLLYLCALRACEEMAKLMGDKDFAAICHSRFLLGSTNLDKVCFTNGKWYTHVVDPKHNVQVLTDATFVGALYGQWWAHLLGLGYLLPKEHIVSHLKYTYERNYVASFDPAKQYPRKYCDSRDDGWVMGQWDGPVPKNALYYSREASWSGALYPFASLMIMEGLKTEGLTVLSRLRYLYDGTRRSPWNEIECGDHYARPMSSWSLFKVASGLRWDILENGALKVNFKPTVCEEDFCGFFVMVCCWGTYSQKLNANGVNSAQLKIEGGSVNIDELTLAVPGSEAIVKVNTDEIALETYQTTVKKNGSMCVSFVTALNLQTDDVLWMEIQ